MGYQEFIIKSSKENLESDIKKLEKIIGENDWVLFDIISKLKQDVYLYPFDKTPFDWTVKLNKDDIFLCITGDRGIASAICKKFKKPYYETDVVMRCSGLANENYEQLFDDFNTEEVEELLKSYDSAANIKSYKVSFVSGHTLKVTESKVTAVNEKEAVEKAFEKHGSAFENRLISVKKINNKQAERE